MTEGLVHNGVNSIAIDSEGNKWFGTIGGVSKFDGINWINYTTKSGLVHNNVLSIVIDSKGNKWFCTYGGGVSFLGKIEENDDNHENEIPELFNLKQNYPNPFNTETTIDYDIKENTKASLKIYNLQGQEVKTIINEYKNAGSYSVKWNGRNNSGAVVSSGIYICTLKTEKYVKSIKMVFLK